MRQEYRPIYNPEAQQSKHWNRYMETMPREDLDALHFRRIKRNVKFAYDNLPFYRKIFDAENVKPADIKSLSDFNEKVPIVDKPDIKRFQERENTDLFSARDPGSEEHHLYRFETSGTTSSPLHEALTLTATVKKGDAWAYGFWRCGMRPDDSFYFAFPFGTFAGFWSAYWGVRRLGGTIRSGAGLSTEERIHDIVKFDPDVVILTPTYATHMVEKAEELGVDLSQTSVRFTVHAGEKGVFVESIRNKIEEGWGAHAWDMYGQSESAFLAPMMDIGAPGVHPCEPYYYSVIVDPETGEVLEEDGQEGEHIVTTHIPSAPGLTLRYRTHDIVEVYEDPSEVYDTDVTWKLFKGSVKDRTDNMVTIKGTNIYPRALEELITGVPGASTHYEFHARRDKSNDDVLVKIEADPDVSSSEYDRLRDRLQQEVKQGVGVTMQFDVLPPGELPRYDLKSQRFFDHRDL